MTSEQLFPTDFQNITEQNFAASLFGYARMYAPYMQVDFDTEVLPFLDNPNWWTADYGVNIENGVEIGMSTKDALRCLVDVHRTHLITYGIHQTVKELKKRSAQVIGIDAGTGTGILAMQMIAAGADHVYALEINRPTYEVTGELIRKLGLSDRITILHGDATKIKIEGIKGMVNLLVSENLATGLVNEPQFAIIRHLSDYLTTDAEIIPYGAEIMSALGEYSWEGIPPKKQSSSVWKLKSGREVSELLSLTTVLSHTGMDIPVINEQFTLTTTPHQQVNTLVVKTRFYMNRLGVPAVLEPSTARFLGKANAFRLPSIVDSETGKIFVSIHYAAGHRTQELIISANGDRISITDPYLE